jgi:hypothetical protein
VGRQHYTSFLDSEQPVAITRHGATIGYYIPVHVKQSQADALRRAGGLVDAMVAGMRATEDELVTEFKSTRSRAERSKRSRAHAA